jgi:flagellar biosynthetic protein FlhB
MAEGERTEAPTPRRLQELKSQGSVVRSTELNTALGLLAGAVTLRFAGPTIFETLRSSLKTTLLHPASFVAEPEELRVLWFEMAMDVVSLVIPIMLAVMVAGVFSNLIQVGPTLNASLAGPKLSRVNPLSGFKRVFGMQGLSELVKSLLKLLVIGAVIYHALEGEQGTVLMLLRRDIVGASTWLAAMSADIMVRVGAAFLILAGLDYLYQRWQFMRNAKMTREQLKEELRSTEGSPEVRARMRQYARTLAMGRMMKAVPTADVIITNPTHLAVAIKYEMGSRAPKVVAKGPNLLAEKIKSIARESGIPIIENRPLAQALYKAVDVGGEIPAALYQVVAEVLAFVYRTRMPRGVVGSMRPA